MVFGPNNFPFAFSGVAGGDFAAAIAAGNPVIGKAHPLHPGTGRLLAEAAVAAIADAGLPPATVQMIYKIDHQSGQRLVSDSRVGASAFTGSRAAGMALKNAADAVGKPIYLEMSSINPVVILPGALAERGSKVAAEVASSCLMGGGQFCTNAGLLVVFAGARSEQFIDEVKSAFDAAQPPALLSEGVAKGLAESVKTLRSAGAAVSDGNRRRARSAPAYPNTLLRVTGQQFLAEPEKLQTEAFGSASLCVVVRDVDEAEAVLSHLEGNLTGCIYSDTQGSDEGLYTPARAGAPQAGGPAAERQDADGRRREPGDESRRAVSRDRPSRIHRSRHSGVVAPLRHAVLLRQRPAAPSACRAARSESQRQNVAPHRRKNDTGFVFMSIIRIDPSFDTLVPRDARIEKVAGGFTFTEGPLWRPNGVLWFSDVVGNVVRQWSPDGTVKELLRPGGYDGNSLPAGGFIGPNGMTAAQNGDVLLCQHGNRRIVQVTNDLRVTTLVDKFEGKRLNAPNDLVYRSDGTLFFTDPPYGLPRQDDDPEKDIPFNGVFKLRNGKAEVIIKDLTRPNGIAFSPDEKTLYVSNSDDKRRIWMRYDVADVRQREQRPGIFRQHRT